MSLPDIDSLNAWLKENGPVTPEPVTPVGKLRTGSGFNGASDFNTSRSRITEFIAKHAIKVHRGPLDYGGGLKWQIECPFNPDHTATDAAIYLGANGAWSFRCSHNSCSGYKWQDLRDRYEPNRKRFEPVMAGARTQNAKNAQPGGDTGLVMQRASDIKVESVEWVWPGRIALRKLTVLAGMPGLGKTQILMWIAAAVSTGGEFPVTGESAATGSVIVLSAEDGAADTLVPRLMAAGADLNKVFIVRSVRAGFAGDGTPTDRMLSLQDDIATLGNTISSIGDVKLVIIDPISSYMGKGVDSHNNTDVRGILAPLAAMAEEQNIAVILNTHLSKAKDQDAMMRVTGSIAFVAAARSAWLAVADKEDPEKRRRLFLPLKNNLAPDHGNGLSYEIEERQVVGDKGPITTSRIKWGSEFVSTAANDAMSDGEKRGAKKDAETWLRQELSNGPVNSSEIFKRGEKAGHSKKTLYRAKDSLGIKAKKPLGIPHGEWSWEMPSLTTNPPAPDWSGNELIEEEI
jgi:putative DNA primase/helicase